MSATGAPRGNLGDGPGDVTAFEGRGVRREALGSEEMHDEIVDLARGAWGGPALPAVDGIKQADVD